ncbi:MAG: SUMF1/EgtB/PvdO family nonheme iron enzyme, partial [Bacteroidota bacterium]
VFTKSAIPIKQIEKQMKEIRTPLYASSVEVTNSAYQLFLEYLEQNGYSEEYEVAKIDLSKFEGVALSSMKSYFKVKPGSRKDDGYQQYPVINITYEAAVLYCEWLTQQYNQQEKRKYQEVRFRLPTLKEWQIAALGYKDFQSWNLTENTITADFPSDRDKNKWDKRSYNLKNVTVSYPWYNHDFTFRNMITNQHDCYLANILDSSCDCPVNKTGDGFTMTSPVGAYFSNAMGLFDVVGNVAEMVQEKGKAAGGSWAHSPEASTITSVSKYQQADAKVGFRVFMEVITE